MTENFRVCTIDLAHVSLEKSIESIPSILSPVVEVLLGEHDDSYAVPLVEKLKEAGKKTLLDTRNGELIAHSDLVFIHSPELVEDRVFEILSCSNKPFFYRINKNLEETKVFLDRICSLKHNYCLSKFSVLVWYDNKTEDDIRNIYEEYGTRLDLVFIDTPECISQKYGLKGSYRSFFDVAETVETEDGVVPYAQQARELFSLYRKRKKCRDCSISSLCLGFIQNTDSETYPLKEVSKRRTLSLVEHSKSIVNRVSAGIYRYSGKSTPESEEDIICQKEIEILQNCRKGDLGSFDFYHIWTVDQSMYFNRHIEQVPLFNHDPRGLDSIDMIFIGAGIPELAHKLKQDLVLPKHGFMILSKVFFANRWSEEDMKALDDFTMTTLKQIIIDYGGNPAQIKQQGNDLMYNGKKFCGKEWKFLPPYGYIENTVITTEYLPEKQWFDQLYHYPEEKTITGITEEVPTCTKDILMQELVSRFNKRFNI